ncbi:MAG: response regulator [Candidatus Omnitrophica bacterium]|nr:response regulator [Candidatus Omnitrophota bacterium]
MPEKIMIVEDEPDILKVTAFRINKAGYETVLAKDGREALDKAAEEKPDLILLDYRIPVLDGAEVFVELRKDPDLSGIPVLFLTASRGNEDLLVKMEQIGAEHCMIKPFDPEELMAKIKELLKG